MSKGEEVEAYTKILKFQNKRYGMGPRDLIIFVVGLVNIVGGMLWLSGSTTNNWGTVFLIFIAFYLLMLTIAFFDFSLGFGLFNENQIVYSGVIVLLTVTISVIITVFAGDIFESNAELLSFVSLLVLLVEAFIISYFIITATPTRQGREEMIRKLTEIKNDIEKIPVGQLGSKSASTRALKWLQFQQRADGIWGQENPLYETSEVLRTLSGLKNGLKHSWKRIENGQEEVRTVEQTYFLVLEALDTAALEPSYEMLLPFLAVTEIDPDQVTLTDEVFIDFEDELQAISEWEFVQSLEDFDIRKSSISEIPVIFPLSLIYYLKGRKDIAQQSADIFSQTFDILIRRSQTRFNIEGEKEVSKLLLGMMYNALVVIMRGPRKINKSDILGEFSVEDDVGDSTMDDVDFDLSDLKIPEGVTDTEMDEEGPSLPSFDFDEDESIPSMPSYDDPSDSAGGFDISLPDSSIEPQEAQGQPEKIKIDVSMAAIRNHIRSLQSIDGSWGGRLDITAECLYAVLDQESPESEFVKLGLHYLLALQEKNGSWQHDEVLTSKILRVLLKINDSMSLGGF